MSTDKPPQPPPVDMVLHCPKCGLQHIDAPEIHHLDEALVRAGLPDAADASWTNPPHRSHLCHGCGHIWRPADVPTNGVAAIKTKGQADSPAPVAAPPEPQQRPVLWWNGIRDYDERDPGSPSFSPVEDTWHDIPLYSGVNPCNALPHGAPEKG